MHFRYARHTNDLQPLVKFYTTIIGLDIIGEFKNHSGYDGVFLGKQKLDWHLEFTASDTPANHKFDEDDLLVFYLKSEEELQQIINRIKAYNINFISPKNPYWRENGTAIMDPEGVIIIFSIRK